MKTCSCCSSTKSKKLKKGLWSPDEDTKLTKFVSKHGIIKWSQVPVSAGLQRCGKSCRLRWLNYLRPGIKRGEFSAEEQKLVFDLHSIYGNRWSLIAQHIPGRTDNEIKNFWNLVRKPSKAVGLGRPSSYRLAVPFRIDICGPNLEDEAKIEYPVHLQQESFLMTEESNVSCSTSSPSIESDMKSLCDLIYFPDAAVHEHTDLFHLLQPDSLPYLGFC